MKDTHDKRKWLIIVATMALLGSSLLESGCSNKVAAPGTQSNKSNVLSQAQASQVQLPITNYNGIQYVKIKQLVDVLNFQSRWDPASSSFHIGDNDANFVIKMNSTAAQKESDSIQLQFPPILINEVAYVPVSALGDLFQQDMIFSINGNQLIIQGSEKDVLTQEIGVDGDSNTTHDPHLNFADDPNDPFRITTKSTEIASFNPINTAEDDASLTVALRNIDVGGLIRKARQYVGVKYIFGAGPYPQSGGFDCSSFTRYIFAKYGIGLARIARDQANQGVSVSRSSLRVGDLMFFNVPGRFKSSSTVGHVGIYLGNGQMISANNQPKNGVQLSNINNAYWKRVFIKAKRLAV